MLYVVVALQALTIVAVIALWLRRPAAPAADPAATEPDPRLAALLAADVPAQLARVDARGEAVERHLREELAQLRANSTADAARAREANEAAAAALRQEVLGNIATLSATLKGDLKSFGDDSSQAAERLRLSVDAQLRTLADKFANFTADNARQSSESRDALHRSLRELGESQKSDAEKVRATVEGRLDALNAANEAKLEQMRATVDEKLQSTLQTRLTESFGQVTDQLTKVHTGLGEMTKLSAEVDDLSKIFTNVKARGGFAEVQLGILLQQMLAPAQYQRNVKVKPNSNEVVEFAVKFPTPQGETFLPIDSKFNKDAWERLETAYASGSSTEIAAAARVFETAIRVEAKRICEKYIAPPHTTSFAVMFLPTEGIYAEVMRRDGLQADIQQNCRVTIAGPSTLSAILSSFQMGFHMLEMQEKGDEVWKVLAKARKEFGTFAELMEKMSGDVARVQGTIDKLGVRTRAINRTLRDVSTDALEAGLPVGAGAFDGLLPLLAAEENEA